MLSKHCKQEHVGRDLTFLPEVRLPQELSQLARYAQRKVVGTLTVLMTPLHPPISAQTCSIHACHERHFLVGVGVNGASSFRRGGPLVRACMSWHSSKTARTIGFLAYAIAQLRLEMYLVSQKSGLDLLVTTCAHSQPSLTALCPDSITLHILPALCYPQCVVLAGALLSLHTWPDTHCWTHTAMAPGGEVVDFLSPALVQHIGEVSVSRKGKGWKQHPAQSCCLRMWQLSTGAGPGWRPHPHGPSLQVITMSSQLHSAPAAST